MKKPGRIRERQDIPAYLKQDWNKIGLTFLTILLLSALMSVNLLPDRISLRLDEISPKEVRANRSVSYYLVSTKYALAQEAARKSTFPVYDRDEGAAFNSESLVKEFFHKIERERGQIERKPKTRSVAAERSIKILKNEYASFSQDQLKVLLNVAPMVLAKLRDNTLHSVRAAMMQGIQDRNSATRPSTDLQHALEDIDASNKISLPKQDASIIHEICKLALRPNLLYNSQRTYLAQEAAAKNVPPVYESISRGERLIGAGERVNQEHLDKFVALGLLNPRLALETGAGVFTLAAVMTLLVVFFIARTLPVLYQDTRRLILLSVIVLMSVLGLKIGGTLLGVSFSSGQLGYLGMMSVAAAGMLVSVLLDMHLAVLVVALLSVQSGLIMNHEIRFTVMTLLSSLVGILCTGGVRNKNNLHLITAGLALANVSLVWLLGMVLHDSFLELLTGSVWAVGSAAFAAFLYWLGVLSLEKPFGILTHTTLLEMSSSDRPLLRELCAVAPGTYAHSMMVGTLAEAGAQAISADSLLCKVGGYYHDIGKIKHPEFFVENQRQGNVHGRLSPSLSALIITAHVRDGVDMATEKRLPKEIVQMIAQHHGTTLIRYFYHQAITDCGGTDEAPPGLEDRFRYPGPKPQTREVAIVMLADSVEAAARTLRRPGQEEIAKLIAGIVREKIEDGQFDDCGLTFQDVKKVTDSFQHVLSAMMHGRIDYPTETPKTASGTMMEVVRSDLRPDEKPLESTKDENLTLPLGEMEAESDEEENEALSESEMGSMNAAYLEVNGYTPSKVDTHQKPRVNPLKSVQTLMSGKVKLGSKSD